MQFPFELLSDADETACKLFSVIKMKNLYGRQVRGIERSTFAFDAGGQLVGEWRGLKVPGHAQEVLDFIKTMKSPPR
jgi:peroxiredoxin Q/BCP